MPKYTRIGLAFLTRDEKHAGTNDDIYLTITHAGEDVVKWRIIGWRDESVWFEDGKIVAWLSHPRKEDSEARTVTSDKIGDDRHPSFFSTGNGDGVIDLSDFRFAAAVRIENVGDNMWKPDTILLWGERQDDGIPVPLAFVRNNTLPLSRDHWNEGRPSMPVPKAEVGDGDDLIDSILMVVTTRNTRHAGTDDRLHLRVTEGSTTLVDHVQQDTPQTDLNKGYANMYTIPVNTPFRRDQLGSGSIELSITGDDAWDPSSLLLYGLIGEQPNKLVPLSYVASWDAGKMSTDTGEGSRAVTLPVVS